MPNRILKESIRTSDGVNDLNDFQFRLWAYLITYVDDYGRGMADPDVLKGFVFPKRKGVTSEQVESTLHDLANKGMITLYVVDDKPYFCFPNWSKHQTVRAKRSKYPSPEEADIISEASEITCKHMQADEDKREQPQAYVSVIENREYENTRIENREYEKRITPYNPPAGEDAQISDPAEEVTLGKTAYTVADVVSLYNSICLSLPRVKTISDARRRQVGARMKMYSYEDFKTLFTKAEASPFLKGANDHNWSADFDWLTKDRNMAKVIDGNYDGLDTRSKNKAAQSPQSVITRLQAWAEKGGS